MPSCDIPASTASAPATHNIRAKKCTNWDPSWRQRGTDALVGRTFGPLRRSLSAASRELRPRACGAPTVDVTLAAIIDGDPPRRGGPVRRQEEAACSETTARPTLPLHCLSSSRPLRGLEASNVTTGVRNSQEADASTSSRAGVVSSDGIGDPPAQGLFSSGILPCKCFPARRSIQRGGDPACASESNGFVLGCAHGEALAYR